MGRQDVLDALARHGIAAVDLIDRMGLLDVDVLDALVHLAWNQPLATRTDRARRVRREHADFFDAFQPAARDVLARLLDKYTEHGIGLRDEVSDGEELRERRDGAAPPAVLAPVPASWAGRYELLADEHGLDAATFRAAVGRVGALWTEMLPTEET